MFVTLLWIQESYLFFIDTKAILIYKHKPILPVPSIMAVTVDKALEFPFRISWVPKSALTAVVIRA